MDPVKSPNILIVSSNKNNSAQLCRFLEQYAFKTVSAHTYEEVENVLKDSNDISLGLIDIGGFDDRIWQVCETLRQKNIGFMIFSPFPNPKLTMESIQSGARAVLTKPLIMKQLLSYIQDFLKEVDE